MNIVEINEKGQIEPVIRKISEEVRKGAVFCYPTDTVYGLGANIYDKNAIEKIYQLKNKDRSHPFSVMIGNVLELKELISEMPETACILIENFWPGPLTIIFKTSEKLKESLPGERETIGIRLPNNKICGFLAKFSGLPIITTSANLSGKKSPKSAADIPEKIKSRCDFIIDSGEIQSTGESTVIDVTSSVPTVIREGVISTEEIQRYIAIKK